MSRMSGQCPALCPAGKRRFLGGGALDEMVLEVNGGGVEKE